MIFLVIKYNLSTLKIYNLIEYKISYGLAKRVAGVWYELNNINTLLAGIIWSHTKFLSSAFSKNMNHFVFYYFIYTFYNLYRTEKNS